MPPSLIIGLTGNIASGKSVVARVLGELGADVIDADQVAHDVLAAGTPQTAQVAARFGHEMLAADGSVDRQRLGARVFRDPEALAQLEAIVVPATREGILNRIRVSANRVVVIEAIKLLEGPLADRVDTVWVVTAPENVRRQRLVATRGLTPAEADARIASQNPEEDKLQRADVIINNSGSLDDLSAQVIAEWEKLIGARGSGAEAAR
jgi:dephospho-CoA kinase